MRHMVIAQIAWPTDSTGALCSPGPDLVAAVLQRIDAVDEEALYEVLHSYYDTSPEELIDGVAALFDGTAVTLAADLVARDALLQVTHDGDSTFVVSAALHSGADPADDVDSPVAMAVGLLSALRVTSEPFNL